MRDYSYLKKYSWKKGQSGNPKGRPKEKTLKEWVRDTLKVMSDEDRITFLKGMKPEFVWRMAEGNPAQDITSGGQPINTFSDEQAARIAERVARGKGNAGDTSGEEITD